MAKNKQHQTASKEKVLPPEHKKQRRLTAAQREVRVCDPLCAEADACVGFSEAAAGALQRLTQLPLTTVLDRRK